MVMLAPSLLEGAALLLSRALVVGAAAGTAGAIGHEAAKRRAEAAERAKAAPIAEAGTQSRTSDACTKCPPDCGTLVARNWNMSEESRTYQARITGFTPRTEWNFKGTDFDGFKSQQCLLLEAKARYDQFFTEDNKPKFFFTIAGLPKMMQQATTQSLLITSSPPSRLHWHFMQPRSHAYLRSAFRRRGFFITTFHTP